MNFEMLDSLTKSEAHALLQRFLDSEKSAIDALRGELRKTDVLLNYRLDEVARTLKWFLGQVRVQNIPVPETEPSWVKKAHQNGLYEFDEDSKKSVLHSAFYLGESFVQANDTLKWSLGNAESIQNNMPVVTGFKRGHELAPLMVTENVFLRILGDGAPVTHIDDMVRIWVSRLP